MSEEILRALMQLFAIIAKQDGGVEANEIEYVKMFLKQQLSDELAHEYLKLFYKHSDLDENGQETEKSNKKKLTSVKDSVKILGICKKINKTLTQKQKVVVLVRLFELINADHKFTEQRMAIINTVAEVFKFTREEFEDVERFVINYLDTELDLQTLLMINDKVVDYQYAKHIGTESLHGDIFVLQIKSVDLYFLRYTGKEDIYLNGLPINNKRIYLFASGSSVKLSKGKPVYYSDVVARYMEDKSLTKISYNVNEVGYTFKTGGIGLRDISFSEGHGKLIGIMGASGAGKTTLLNILAGINTPTSGNVKINGIDLHQEKENLEGVIGLIPQDDLLIEELTVFENLYFSAKLCFKDRSEEEISQMVDQTLTSLGLYDRKNLKVGSPLNKMISGGQRKRLNIALELIREPSILFVDEPTSGLSSNDSENVMDLLRELTLKGKLIFVVIHQPSSDIYKMFDNMLILDTGGYQIYYGNPVEAVMYFKKMDMQINPEIGECQTCGNVNPELIFNIIEAQVVDEFGKYTNVRKVPPIKWEEHFNENIKVNQMPYENEAPPQTLSIPSRLKQFFIYTKRDFLSKISNRQYITMTLLEMPILAFILAFVIRYIADPNSNVYIFRENENIVIYIFMALICALFIGLTVSAEEIFKDRKILKREAFLNLSRSSYLSSKIIILITLSAIQTFMFIIIANSILGIKDMTFAYWFTLFTTSVCANMLGLNISATFNSAVTIYIVIPLLMIPMMVLSGAMFSFDKLNRSVGSVDKVPIIAEFMPTKWGYEALIVNQYKDNGFQKYFFDIDKEISKNNYRTVYYIPEIKEYIEQSIFMIGNKEKVDELEDNLELIRNELASIQSEITDSEFSELNNLTIENFTADIGFMAIEFADGANKHYAKQFGIFSNKKDKIIDYLNRTQPDLYRLKQNMYHNENLSDYVKKVFEKNQILRYNNNLVQQYDPIYQDPRPDHLLSARAHFLAPRKHFLGHYFDTFWFNISVLWLFSIILYITLYYESFKKLLNLFDKN